MKDGILLPGTAPAALLVLCTGCRNATWTETPFPLIVQSWSDIPLPSGWAWQATTIDALSAKPIAAPYCARCRLSREIAGEVPTVDALPVTGLARCVHCMSGTLVHPDFPVVLTTWADVPMPAGWEMQAVVLRADDIERDVCTPDCPDCKAARERSANDFEQREDKARNLVDPEFLAGGASIGGPSR